MARASTEGAGGRADRRKLVLRALATARFVQADHEAVEIPGASGLFLGSVGAAWNEQELARRAITHVLTLSADDGGRVAALTHKLGLAHLAVNVADQAAADLAACFGPCFAFVDAALAAEGRVLVHCFQGKSRSTAIVAGYLMTRQGVTLNQALDLIRQVRPHACPNLGFVAQLRQLGRAPFAPAALPTAAEATDPPA